MTALRDRILDAAVTCFAEDGYERTTVARIRARSGVSNGALFHHFPTKEAIAGALYVDAMRSVQAGYWAVLDARPRSLAAAVEGFVAQLLGWVEAHPDRARFLYTQGHLESGTAADAELAELNRDLAAAYRDWLAPRVAAGEVRDLPLDLVLAIVTGPAHAVAQRWLAGRLDSTPGDAIGPLAEAALAGLTGTPTTRRRRRATPARLRVQLLDDDGAVVAEGETVARPAPRR